MRISDWSSDVCSSDLNHNGAVFLGLNGVVLKSHGSADAKGVANAVHLCAELIEKDITRQVTADLANFRQEDAACRGARSRRAPVPPCRASGCRTPSSPRA